MSTRGIMDISGIKKLYEQGRYNEAFNQIEKSKSSLGKTPHIVGATSVS